MKNNIKITDEQIKAMQSFLSGLAFTDKKQRQDLKLLYSVLSPEDVYVKYTSYSLMPDNGIESSYKILCIKPDGSNANCVDQFDNMNQRLEFETNLIEVDLDRNGKLVFV
jgi:hypothetical protein